MNESNVSDSNTVNESQALFQSLDLDQSTPLLTPQ